MSKIAYFNITIGLRGCYMPDNAFTVRVTTRRELRAIIAGECATMRDAHGFGGSQKDIAATVAAIWRETRKGARKSFYPFVIGFGRVRDASDRPFGVFVGHATREEWEEYQAQYE